MWKGWFCSIYLIFRRFWSCLFMISCQVANTWGGRWPYIIYISKSFETACASGTCLYTIFNFSKITLKCETCRTQSWRHGWCGQRRGRSRRRRKSLSFRHRRVREVPHPSHRYKTFMLSLLCCNAPDKTCIQASQAFFSGGFKHQRLLPSTF